MPITIRELTSSQEVRQAEAAFLAAVQKLPADEGRTGQANSFANGCENVLDGGIGFLKRQNKFCAAVTEQGDVVGLLRLKVPSNKMDPIHIANVTALPRCGAGAELCEFTKALSMEAGYAGVDLSTADEGLVGYYRDKLGFEMNVAEAKTGNMSWTADKGREPPDRVKAPAAEMAERMNAAAGPRVGLKR